MELIDFLCDRVASTHAVLQIPEKLGTGDICLCDTRLCNGAVGIGSGGIGALAVALAAAAVARWLLPN